MCLAVPFRVVEIRSDNIAVCEISGIRKEVLLDLMYEPVSIGDYVLIHVGYAITKLNEVQAMETLNMYREMSDV
ncbi:MAG: HypC/HybG/HupF family hydrogenase formation chaperone [Nitrospirae bacterium]|nr:HypC/HybG/HupF family hydrogenase formation chaperone [Nitrospirota bacterium]